MAAPAQSRSTDLVRTVPGSRTLLNRPGSHILKHMPVSANNRDLCRSLFPSQHVELAIMALETYSGPGEAAWVHRAALVLSDGRLNRLSKWLDSAEREPETFRWYADRPTGTSRESHSFAVDFINGLIDNDIVPPPAA